MEVAVIGAGNIGGTIGAAWEKAGHEVSYGLRDPAKKKNAKSFGTAIEGAEVVLLALPGSAVVDFVREHKTELDGKILIDATNNFRGASAHSWAQLGEIVPTAHLFRAFNTLGWEMFADPVLGGEKADLFYAGASGSAASTVERLIEDVGLRPIRVGGPDQADVVDGVLRLWFALTKSRGRRIAFKLISD